MPVVPDPGLAFERADALVEQRRPDEAAAVLTDALAAHPEHPELWGELALAHLAGGRPVQALDAAARVVRLTPDDEWGHRLASLALSRLGRGAEAAAAARESVRLAPGEPLTHVRLAEALAAAGRADEAEDARRHARSLLPGRDTGPAARDPDIVVRTEVARMLRAQWVLGVACYLGLAFARTAPYAVAAVTAAVIVLGASGSLRWQALPPAVRTAARRSAARNWRSRVLVLLAGAGVLALVAVVPAAMLGELLVARVASVASVAATVVAVRMLAAA